MYLVFFLCVWYFLSRSSIQMQSTQFSYCPHSTPKSSYSSHHPTIIHIVVSKSNHNAAKKIIPPKSSYNSRNLHSRTNHNPVMIHNPHMLFKCTIYNITTTSNPTFLYQNLKIHNPHILLKTTQSEYCSSYQNPITIQKIYSQSTESY